MALRDLLYLGNLLMFYQGNLGKKELNRGSFLYED